MADNLVVGTATGAQGTVAADLVTVDGTAVYIVRNKLGFGPDGSYTEVSTGAGSAWPVQVMGGTVNAGTVTVGGTALVSVQGTANVNVTGGTVNVAPISGTVAVSGNVEITNDAGNPIPVSLTSTTVTGNVEVTNDAGNPLPVSWTGGTVNVAGTVSIHETGTANVNVTGGTVSVNPISGTVSTAGTTLIQGTASIAGTVPISIPGTPTVYPFAQTNQGTSGVSGTVTGTAIVQVLGAAGASLKNYLTSVLVTNIDTASTVLVDIVDGTGSTAGTIWTMPAAGGAGGAVCNFTWPVPQPSTNLAIGAKCRTAGGSVIVSAAAVKLP